MVAHVTHSTTEYTPFRVSLWAQTQLGRTVIRTPEAWSSGPGPKKGHDRAARIGGSDPGNRSVERSPDPRKRGHSDHVSEGSK